MSTYAEQCFLQYRFFSSLARIMEPCCIHSATVRFCAAARCFRTRSSTACRLAFASYAVGVLGCDTGCILAPAYT